MSMKILAAIKKMFDFRNYLTKSKYYDNSNKLVIGKMKDETGGIAIEEFVGLKPKINLFLVDNSQYKKAKGVNRNNVATVSHNEYKDALQNNKCIRHSMNRFKIKTIEQELTKSTKFPLHKKYPYWCYSGLYFPAFGLNTDDKINIQNNGYDGLALGYQS